MDDGADARVAAARWALLLGNFTIGCGVMVVAGSLNDLSRDLAVSAAVAGQLISIAAIVMSVAAPLAAGVVAGWDRRRLLALTMLWFGAGHLASALAPGFALLAPLRALTLLGAAVFTPQAAATIGLMAPPQQRGRHMTFIFMGWSLASVLGLPLAAWLAETHGWRTAFAAVAALALLAAAAVWRAVPDGVRPPAMSMTAWRSIFTHPVLMAIVAVTAFSAAGQFTLFSYFAPFAKQTLGADGQGVGLLFAWFGLCGLGGQIVLARHVDRIGAARAAGIAIGFMIVSFVLWPLATTLPWCLAVLTPWGLGCFASNSAQQARVGIAVPALAPALMALNTAAIYLGQAVGAASGGATLATHGFGALHLIGLAWLVAALGLSVWAARQPIGALAR